jgi:hypothetical protein
MRTDSKMIWSSMDIEKSTMPPKKDYIYNPKEFRGRGYPKKNQWEQQSAKKTNRWQKLALAMVIGHLIIKYWLKLY